MKIIFAITLIFLCVNCSQEPELPSPYWIDGIQVGIINVNEEFTSDIETNMPIVTDLTSPLISSCLSRGYGRILQIGLQLEDGLQDSGYVHIAGKDAEGYEILFKAADTTDNIVYYRSMVGDFGKPVIFTTTKMMDGVTEHAYIIYVLDDYLDTELVESSFLK